MIFINIISKTILMLRLKKVHSFGIHGLVMNTLHRRTYRTKSAYIKPRKGGHFEVILVCFSIYRYFTTTFILLNFHYEFNFETVILSIVYFTQKFNVHI